MTYFSRFPLFRVLLFGLLGAALSQPARAWYVNGGELTYYSLGNNQYRVHLAAARENAVGNPTGSFALVCKATGCGGAGATVTATLLPTAPAVTPNGPTSPFCAQVAAAYPLGGLPPVSYPNLPGNYDVLHCEAVVTLPPAAEWVLSVEESARVSTANLVLPGTVRFEATLNNLITTAGGATVALQNNSPQFDPQLPLTQLVCWQRSSTVSFRASDADRLNLGAGGQGRPDSLVYSLERPLTSCGTYETYAAYPSTGCVTRVDPNCSSRIIRCSNSPGTYGATIPVAVANDTIPTGPCTPGTTTFADVRPRFAFNAGQGSFRLTPNRFLPGLAALGDNKYVVVGKVTEYRRLNGRYYKVGSVRRDFLVIVVDCGANLVPNVGRQLDLDTTYVSCCIGCIIGDTLLVAARTCSYGRLRIGFSDPNPSDVVTVYPPADLNTTLLQNGTIGTFSLSGNGTRRPVGTFYFQPNASTVGTDFTATFRVEDNACPYKGIQYVPVRIRVVPGQGARARIVGVGNPYLAPPTLCAGAAPVGIPLLGSVSRPDSVRNQATGQVGLQTYNYQWTATPAATAGLPAATNTAALTVLPTATTRYHLTVTPALGFVLGCADTASVLVQVVPQPGQPVVTTVGNALMSSYASGNQWYLNGAAIPGATGQSYVPNPPPGPAYHYQVSTSIGTPPYACTSPLSARAGALGGRAATSGTALRLAPNPTPDGRIQVTLTGYRQPVTLAVFDALGRAVTTQTVAAPDPAGTVRALELGAAAPGVYVLRVLTEGGVDVRRVVRE